ncbi:aminoglycoside adenylyltransferase domain-containing protein [Blastococcus sp. SYSU D00669]
MRSYADEVARRVAEVLGERLIGVWLVGSCALGDFDPARSDIDIQAVAAGPVSSDERQELVARLRTEALPVPARGLEFVLYAAEDLTAPGGPRFSLNLNTGPRMDLHVVVDPADDPGFWFTIDLDIARLTALPLLGPPAAEVFPELRRDLVARAVVEGLDWWSARSGTPAQTLLSACRSWAWATDGRWRSKTDSARWAMARLPDPRGVEAALRARRGEEVAPPGRDDVETVVAAARARLSCRVPP